MRTRNSHRTVQVWESYYDDYENLLDEELVEAQKEWRHRRHGENRSRTFHGRIYRQDAPYKDDPVIWTLMDVIPQIAVMGMALSIIGAIITQVRAEEHPEVTQ